MDSIRTQIVEAPLRDAGSAGPAPGGQEPPPVPNPDAPRPLISDGTPISSLLTQIELMRQRQSTQFEYMIASHRPVSGWVFNLLKRFVYWGARPFVSGIREKQESFNEATLHAMREVSLQLENYRAVQQQLRQQIEEQQQGLRQELEGQQQGLRQEIGAVDERLLEQSGELSRQLGLLQARHDLGPFYSEVPADVRLELMNTNRGTFEDIQGRQTRYLEYFRNPPGQVLDLGCGRGELLALLRHHGIESWGAEIDPLMIEQARSRGVYVEEHDALHAMAGVEDGKLGGLFAAQVVEHLFPGELLELLRQARRKLAPGARIVLETINAGSLGAIAKSYFRDLDHKQPIHPEYLKLLLILAGFEQVELHYLAPFSPEERLNELPAAEELGIPEAAREALQQRFALLDRQIFGMQDYFVVGVQGSAPAQEGDGG